MREVNKVVSMRKIKNFILFVIVCGLILFGVWYNTKVGTIQTQISIYEGNVFNKESILYSDTYKIYKVEVKTIDGEIHSFEGFEVYNSYDLNEKVLIKKEETITQHGELMNTKYSMGKITEESK